MIIAIDGPAASGKGTLAKRLAAHFGFRHLDTGLLYRAVAQALLDAGHEPTERDAAIAAAKTIDPAKFDETALKRHDVGEAASVVSAIPGGAGGAVQASSRISPRRPPGAVLDGRDIGTVICPNADVKIFVTATPEVRARRRDHGTRGRGETADEAAVLADILRPRRARPVAQRGAADAGRGRPSARHQRARHRRVVQGCAGPGRAGQEPGQALVLAQVPDLRLYPRPSGPPHSSVWAPERAEGAVHRPSRLEDQSPASSHAAARRTRTIVSTARFARRPAGYPAVAEGLRSLRPARSERHSIQPPAHRFGDFMATATSYRAVARRFRRNARRVLRPAAACRKAPSSRGPSSASRRTSPSSTSALKTEGRVALREFAGPGRADRDQDRRHRRGLSGARRERARRGGAVARQGAARGELGQAREGLQEQREGHGRHLQPGQGRLHRRSRRRRGVPAALAGRHPADPRRHPADERRRSRSRS